MNERTSALLDGVIDLFPGTDRQALTCLAELMEKDRHATERQLAEARAALEPFTRIGWLPSIDDEEWAAAALCRHVDLDPEFTVGDCRRARAVLA